jgi:hypothetical protein
VHHEVQELRSIGFEHAAYAAGFFGNSQAGGFAQSVWTNSRGNVKKAQVQESVAPVAVNARGRVEVTRRWPLPNQPCQRRFLFLQPAIYECPLELSQMRTKQPVITADIAPMCRDAESVYMLHILPFPISTLIGARYPTHRRIPDRRH